MKDVRLCREQKIVLSYVTEVVGLLYICAATGAAESKESDKPNLAAPR